MHRRGGRLTAATLHDRHNDFIATGGDGYPNGAAVTTRDLMDQVLADYVDRASPIGPAIQGRIVCTNDRGHRPELSVEP